MEVSQLNEKRKQAGLSIEELSKRANLPKSTVEKVLFGVVKYPRIDTMRAIEDALELNQTTATITDNDKASDVGIQLSEKEQELLSLFRVLNSPMQDYVIQIIKAIPKTS